MRDKNSPEIRFPGFSEEWEQMKLGEVVEIKDSARISNTLWVSKGVPYLRSSDLANDEIVGELFISDETYQSYKDKTGAPEKDDVLFTSGGKVGVTYHKIDNNPVYVQGGSILYAKTSTSNKLSGIYLKAFFSSPTMTKYIEGASTGLTIKHFTLKPANAAPIFISSLKEQNKIGEFFKKIDDAIAFHQQELSIFKQTKQGFLQKMFPKEGESVPEVRFPGFIGDWEQRKLGDLSNIRRGASPRPIQDPKWFDDESDVGWLRISDVTEQNGLIHHVEQHISEEGQKKTLVLNEPHLILSIAATVGKPVINYIKTGIHDGFIVFINPQFNIDFMFQWLGMFRPKWQKYGQPGSQVNINSELVREQDVFLPSLEEQEKISEFFKRFDETIALHQHKIDALKETKKAFLQKIFA